MKTMREAMAIAEELQERIQYIKDHRRDIWNAFDESKICDMLEASGVSYDKADAAEMAAYDFKIEFSRLTAEEQKVVNKIQKCITAVNVDKRVYFADEDRLDIENMLADILIENFETQISAEEYEIFFATERRIMNMRNKDLMASACADYVYKKTGIDLRPKKAGMIEAPIEEAEILVPAEEEVIEVEVIEAKADETIETEEIAAAEAKDEIIEAEIVEEGPVSDTLSEVDEFLSSMFKKREEPVKDEAANSIVDDILQSAEEFLKEAFGGAKKVVNTVYTTCKEVVNTVLDEVDAFLEGMFKTKEEKNVDIKVEVNMDETDAYLKQMFSMA